MHIPTALKITRNALIILLSLPAIAGDTGGTFRFGSIQWKRCSAGFHDTLFPEVCADTNQNRVAFTVECAWSIPSTFLGLGTMIPNGLQEVITFKENMNVTSVNLDYRALTVNRLWCGQNTQGGTSCAVLRGIGYRFRIDNRQTPADESIQPTLSQDSNTGAICATSTNLQAQRPSCTSVTSYTFRIDRVSSNAKNARDPGDVVYARYTFDILFPDEGDYTVFFEGCCRPSDVNNNPQRPFHLRTGLRLYHNDNFPSSSIRFAMPDSIFVLQGRRTSYTDNTCRATADCTDLLTCLYTIALQAWFSDDRFFDPVDPSIDVDAAVEGNNGIVFSEATPNEMGYFWCLANSALSALVYGPGKCEGGASGFMSPKSVQMPDFAVTDGTIVVSSRLQGLWTASVVACLAVQRVESCVQADFIISVDSNSQSGRLNPRPPLPDFSASALLGGIVPVTNRSNPVRVRCGNPTWRLGPPGRTPEVTGTSLQVVFVEQDQWTSASPTCQGSQGVNWIEPGNSLPQGVQLAARALPVSGRETASYLTVQWKPMCENPSHIGLFMFCFRANDRLLPSAGIGLVPSTSLPGPPQEIPDASPCEYVRVEKAEFPPDPDMTLELCLRSDPASAPQCNPYPAPVCSGDCCHCCSEPNCPCEGAGVKCCAQIYAPLQQEAVIIFRASTKDPSYLFSRMSFEYSFNPSDFLPGFRPTNRSDPPCLNSQTSCPGCLGIGTGTCVPPVSPYTASDVGYINWDLRRIIAFSVDEQRSLAQAKRVCVRVVKAVPEDVDRGLWSRAYPLAAGNASGVLRGFEPSCGYCFALRGAGIPFFVKADPTNQPVGTESSEVLNVVGGTERVVLLMGASAIMPNPSILLEGSLPGGARLGKQVQVKYAGVPSGFATQRELRFTPRPGQEGMTHRVCFTVFDRVDKSPFLCFSLNVMRAEVTWQASDWPVGVVGGLVPKAVAAGCTYRFQLGASSQYQLSVEVQPLPRIQLCSAALIPSGIECLKLQGPPSPQLVGPSGLDIGVDGCDSAGLATFKLGRPCCGNGRCDGAEIRSTCPADCREDDGVMLESAAPRMVVGNLSSIKGQMITEAQLTWAPPRGLTGRSVLLCLAAVPPGGAGLVSQLRIGRQGPTLCLYAEVQRCQYCMPFGSSMQDVGLHLLRTTNWPLLYNANPTIQRPSFLLGDRQVLSLGPVYNVRPGDSLLSIAGWSRSTVKSILALNPDLDAGDVLEEGQHLCIFVCSAAGSNGGDAGVMRSS